MKKESPLCAKCPYPAPNRLCRKKDGKSPPFCPTENKKDLAENCLKEYEIPEILTFAKQAAIQEAEGYINKESGYERVRPLKCRLEEVTDFAKKMKYNRLGLAFCIGLRAEAAVVEKIFSGKGFEVVSVVCKVGQVPKERIGVHAEQQLSPEGGETMCNPILQASILNSEKTDFNVLLGLCVGHDSLFFKYAQAPCTVLAVKDRLLGHNPLAAVYNMDSYYRSLKA
ncbi:MAG: metal-binding protein [Desulfobacteraceae bacterium IS3]|nr:MAG: metal-binding protein [Desulfobacteraceae bacterium IS3]